MNLARFAFWKTVWLWRALPAGRVQLHTVFHISSPAPPGSAPSTPFLPDLPWPRASGALLEKLQVCLPLQTVPSWLCWGLGLGTRGGAEENPAAPPVPRRPCSSQAGREARDLARWQPGGERCQLQGRTGLLRPQLHPQDQGTQDNCAASPGPVSSSLMWGDRHPTSSSLT